MLPELGEPDVAEVGDPLSVHEVLVVQGATVYGLLCLAVLMGMGTYLFLFGGTPPTSFSPISTDWVALSFTSSPFISSKPIRFL